MATLLKLHRVLVYSILSAAALVLLGFVAIHIQQEILRYRAQRLLSDIRSIDLRHTTFAEVQPILRRWRSESHYGRPCSTERCDVTIALPYATFYKNGFVFWVDDWLVHTVLRATLLARAHPFIVVASVSVRKGVVWGKSFSINVVVEHSRKRSSPYPASTYSLVGTAKSVSRFTFGRVFEGHPDYQVGMPGACTGCLEVWLKFTPFANAADVSRLMQFNLDCITRWRPCRAQQDIMPTAWAQLQREKELAYKRPACTLVAAEIAARDAENAATIQIVKVGESLKDERHVIPATAQMLQRLKNGDFWSVGTRREFLIPQDYIVSTPRSISVRAGTRWILLFDVILGGVDAHECGMVPFSNANLALVREGISQDYLAADGE